MLAFAAEPEIDLSDEIEDFDDNAPTKDFCPKDERGHNTRDGRVCEACGYDYGPMPEPVLQDADVVQDLSGTESGFVPTPGPKDGEVVEFLTGDDPVMAGLLEDAFITAAQPWTQGMSLQELSDAYTTASYWYACSKDRKRRAKASGDWGDEDVLKAQLAEDYMEALVKALDKALMVAMAVAKHGG